MAALAASPLNHVCTRHVRVRAHRFRPCMCGSGCEHLLGLFAIESISEPRRLASGTKPMRLSSADQRQNRLI
jgi:hypothetical protein